METSLAVPQAGQQELFLNRLEQSSRESHAEDIRQILDCVKAMRTDVADALEEVAYLREYIQSMENVPLKTRLGTMQEDPPLLSETLLDSPDKVVRFMAEELRKYDRELFCILNLKAKAQVINMNITARGSLDGAAASPREVFKSSILSNAAAGVRGNDRDSC